MGRAVDDPDRLPLEDVKATFAGMEDADWKRAERMAKALAHRLPGMSAEDLLQEVVTQLVGGERRFPRGIHPLVVLKTAMRSEASNVRKSAAARRTVDRYAVDPERDEVADGRALAPGAKEHRTPEVEALAEEEFNGLTAALAGDADVEFVAMAWADGLRGAAAQDATGLDAKAYDAARKRLMRKLETLADERGGS